MVNALLDCGADPTLLNSDGFNPLMMHVLLQLTDVIVRLLQDPRVQASVNMQISNGATALIAACHHFDKPEGAAIFQLLLPAGADLTLTNARGQIALNVLKHDNPTHPATLVLVAQSLDAEKASFLIKARRLVMAATTTTPPSSLQDRVAHELPLPAVALAPVTKAQDEEEAEDEEKARRELRTMLAWLVGVEGGGGMPRDVFRVVLDLLMPWWDPLRRKAQAPPQV